MGLGPATHPAKSAVFAIHNGDEQLLAAHAAQRSSSGNNLRQTGSQTGKAGNGRQGVSDRYAVGKETGGENKLDEAQLNRTFHRIAQLWVRWGTRGPGWVARY